MPQPLWFHFAPFHLDVGNGQLYCGTSRVALRPKTLAVLQFLAQRAGDVVTKAEVLAAVWPDVTTLSGTLSSSIVELRRALGDTRKQARFIETVHGRGFRFAADVEISFHAGDRPRRALARSSGRTPFIGRSSTMTRLEAELQQVVAGEARAILIAGPAGIGKSRLLHEFASVERHRVLALHAHADDASQHSDLWLWSQILCDYAQSISLRALRTALGAAAPDVAAVIPSVQERLGDVGPPVVLEPGLARTRIFDGIKAFLRRASAERPLLLVLDDIHKASALSLALLQSVVTAPDIRGLLVLAACRDDPADASSALSSLLEAVRRSETGTWLTLPALVDGETRELIAATGLELAAPLVDRIVRDGGGNPYFVVEILESVRRRSGDGEIAGYEIPSTVRRLIEGRQAGLTAEARTFLKIGAVAGTTFEPRVIAQVQSLDRDSVWNIAAETSAAGLLVQAEGDLLRFRFRHDIVRETLLAAVSEAEQADLHARIGEALEQVGGSTEPDLPRLAFHFSRGARPDNIRKAVEYCVRAGRLALQRYENSAAREHLSRALELADHSDEPPGPLLFQALENLAEANARLERFAESETFADRLYCLAKLHGEPLWVARSAVAMVARSYVPFRPSVADRVISILQDALDTLSPEPTYVRGQVTARLALALLTRTDHNERRIQLGREAVAIARQQLDINERAWLLTESVAAFWDADHVDERLALAAELREVAVAGRNAYAECAALGWKGLGLVALGRFREADELAQYMTRSLVRFRAVDRLLQLFRITRATLGARFTDAQDRIDEYTRQEPMNQGIATQMEVLFQQAVLLRERGQLQGVAPMFRAMAQQLSQLPLRFAVPLSLAEGGLIEEARAELDAICRHGLADLPPRNEAFCWLAIVASLGDTCATVGSDTYARPLYETLLPYEQQWSVVHLTTAVIGSVGRVLGRLAARIGAMDRARDHFEAMIRRSEEEGVITELIRTKRHYAEALELRDPADPRARQLRRQAGELGDQHDLAATGRRARV